MWQARDWSKAELDTLTADWADGLSVSAMRDKYGRSNNSITGKVHRLNLPARPSPIRRRDSDAPPKPARAKSQARRDGRAGPATLSAPSDLKAPPQALPSAADRGRRQCQWLEGRNKPWIQCTADSLTGDSWCQKHRGIVFKAAAPVEQASAP